MAIHVIVFLRFGLQSRELVVGDGENLSNAPKKVAAAVVIPAAVDDFLGGA